MDGENDVSTIVELSGRENPTVVKILLSLRDRGLIRSVKSVPVAAPELSAAAGAGSLLGRLAAGSLALSLILSIGIVLTSRDGSFAAFRAAGHIQDLRSMIEAYKVEHGAYPQELSVVSKESDPWGRPYVYRFSDGAFVLFSAGPDGKEGSADDIR